MSLVIEVVGVREGARAPTRCSAQSLGANKLSLALAAEDLSGIVRESPVTSSFH